MSMLLDSMEKCVFLEKKREPDGVGGYINRWEDGAEFRAAIAFNSSMEARIGEKTGVTSLYTVTTNMGVKLEYHDTFRRIRDGKTFRVTSDGDDMISPKIATFRVLQVSAEEWSPA